MCLDPKWQPTTDQVLEKRKTLVHILKSDSNLSNDSIEIEVHHEELANRTNSVLKRLESKDDDIMDGNIKFNKQASL
jgi:hypothetical protein